MSRNPPALRAQLNLSLHPHDAQEIRDRAAQDGTKLHRLVVRAVLGREPTVDRCPTCRRLMEESDD